VRRGRNVDQARALVSTTTVGRGLLITGTAGLRAYRQRRNRVATHGRVRRRRNVDEVRASSRTTTAGRGLLVTGTAGLRSHRQRRNRVATHGHVRRRRDIDELRIRRGQVTLRAWKCLVPAWRRSG